MKIVIMMMLASLYLYASSAFISSVDLQSKLDNNKVVIIDVTDEETYNLGHIPNAVRADVSSFRYAVKKHQLMRSSEEIQEIARTLGINNDSEIILYGHGKEKEILKASYMALSFMVNGAENVSILNGGYADWLYEDSKFISTEPTKVNKGNFTAKLNQDILVDLEYVKNNINKVPMLEARPSKFFYGKEKSNGVKRLGHITGAESSFWKKKFNQDEFVIDREDLDDIFITQHKLNQNEEVILYCTGGLEASMNWYLLYKELGFKNAKIYDGSMREWGNRDDTPMEI